MKTLAARKRSISLGWKLSLKLSSVAVTLILFIVIIFAAIGQDSAVAKMADNITVQTWSQFRRMKIREVLFILQIWAAPLNGTTIGTDASRYSDAIKKLDELNNIDYSKIEELDLTLYVTLFRSNIWVYKPLPSWCIPGLVAVGNRGDFNIS